MRAARQVWAVFWELVDSDSVRPFIYLYYVPLFGWGVFATIFLPFEAIEPVMGGVVANLWVWTQIPATSSAMLGLALRHGGTPISEMSRLLLFRDWWGLGMQFGGHACMCLVLLGFEIAGINLLRSLTMDSPYWWLLAFAVFAISSYVIGCFLLSLQVARKVWKGIQLRRAAQ